LIEHKYNVSLEVAILTCSIMVCGFAVGERAHGMLKMVYKVREMMYTGLRPMISERGDQSRGPTANPQTMIEHVRIATSLTTGLAFIAGISLWWLPQLWYVSHLGPPLSPEDWV
jgi:hypothetical protein